MRRLLRKIRHIGIKLVFLLLWVGMAYQAIVYFINPVRVESYRLAVEYWQWMWNLVAG